MHKAMLWRGKGVLFIPKKLIGIRAKPAQQFGELFSAKQKLKFPRMSFLDVEQI
jgi:hypothetical protein